MSIDAAAKIFELARAETSEWFQQEVLALRSGRVKPDLVERVSVESYGARSPLNSLASVNSSDARTLVVSPWDKNIIPAVEKAITEANLGVNPVVNGGVIRLSFPSMTQEVRQQVLKVLHGKAEDARVRLRQGRDEALKLLRTEKEKGDIPEDDFYSGKERLDNLIEAANQQVADLVKAKTGEIESM